MPIFKKIMGQVRRSPHQGLRTALRQARRQVRRQALRQARLPGLQKARHSGPAPSRTMKMVTDADDGGNGIEKGIVDNMFFTVIPRTCAKCQDFKWAFGWNRRDLVHLKCFKRKFVNNMPFHFELLDHHRVFGICPFCYDVMSIGLSKQTTATVVQHMKEKHYKATFGAYKRLKLVGKHTELMEAFKLFVKRQLLKFQIDYRWKVQMKINRYRRELERLTNELGDNGLKTLKEMDDKLDVLEVPLINEIEKMIKKPKVDMEEAKVCDQEAKKKKKKEIKEIRKWRRNQMERISGKKWSELTRVEKRKFKKQLKKEYLWIPNQ